MLLVFVCPKRHVIRLTPELWKQGCHREINLGEVVDEAMVDSSKACGRLCEENPVCDSVMLMGKLCRMYTTSHYPVSQHCDV